MVDAGRSVAVSRSSMGLGVANNSRCSSMIASHTAGLHGLRQTAASAAGSRNSFASHPSISYNTSLLSQNIKSEEVVDDYDMTDYTGRTDSIYYEDPKVNVRQAEFDQSTYNTYKMLPPHDNGWFCDLCNIPLLTTLSLSQVRV